jgi:DUF4097 and DUF4098 domain-containing protein YvlB
MENIIYICVTAILMSFSNTLFSQQIVEKSSPIKADQELKLNFEFADKITVTTWDKNEVYVKATVSINDNADNDHFILDVNQKSYGIEFESEIENMKSLQTRKKITDEDGSTIIYNSVDMDLYFEVKVPKDIELEIETISGDIELKNVLGKMDINTISGFIDVTLPVKHNADLELSTISGAMYSDFEFNKEKNNGYHHYGKRDLSKKLNSGGTKIYLETISGDIYLRKDK